MFVKVKIENMEKGYHSMPEYISDKAYESLNDGIKQYYFYKNEHLTNTFELLSFQEKIFEENEIAQDLKN